jgi:hypothetical protein
LLSASRGDLQQMQLLFGRQVDLLHAAIEFDTRARDAGQVVDDHLQRLREPARPDTAAKRAQQLPQIAVRAIHAKPQLG